MFALSLILRDSHVSAIPCSKRVSRRLAKVPWSHTMPISFGFVASTTCRNQVSHNRSSVAFPRYYMVDVGCLPRNTLTTVPALPTISR